ncbi:MAG: Si-specific NAD(P)(+) transhydrogenase [Planctomycetes bacterium]|nr:Si-specific NAD(P)(+) transhydrogenase [Planctomycetota bacterium]
MSEVVAFDVVVIGSGPAGQKAAIQAAKTGRTVLLVERERGPGGACVHHGTIPSKTLRETALHLQRVRRLGVGLPEIVIPEHQQVAGLMGRLADVVGAHERFIAAQLERNGVVLWHGRARFVDAHHLEVLGVRGARRVARGERIVIATGSRPRTPKEVPVDHEHVLDSDSILSMIYLPSSLTVLGAGVIASEYASIFAALGVAVTLIDKADRPLGFLDPECSERFVRAFEANPGCRFMGRAKLLRVAWDGAAQVVTELEGGGCVRSDKLLCALGRVANLEDLQIGNAGLKATDRGVLAVDAQLRTAVPHIFAAGDVIGPPSLASASMEQGRRAMRAAFDLPLGMTSDLVPAGIYTIPEMATVGLSEAQAREQHGEVRVGRARFEEIARGQILGETEGFLKLVADAGGRLLGAQIVGEGATELIHLAQMALVHGDTVDAFVENIFNFPTLAEAYRVAALEIQRATQSNLDGRVTRA